MVKQKEYTPNNLQDGNQGIMYYIYIYTYTLRMMSCFHSNSIALSSSPPSDRLLWLILDCHFILSLCAFLLSLLLMKVA